MNQNEELKINELQIELEAANRKAMDYQNAESYVRKLWHEEVVKLKAEIERLTNQYNEQLDLARHRAVELEQAKAEYTDVWHTYQQIQSENAALTLMAESYRANLWKYGRHKEWCVDQDSDNDLCDCGWSEVCDEPARAALNDGSET